MSRNGLPLVMIIATTLVVSSLVACSSSPGAQEKPTTAKPTLVLADNIVSASGEVLPERWVNLAFASGGTKPLILVEPGDQVDKDKILAQVDDTGIQLEVGDAERALRELTSPAAVAAAEQAVIDAKKNLEDAQDKRDSYNYQRASSEQVDNAEANLALAQQKMDEAFDLYQKFKNYPPENPKRAQAYTTYYAARQARDNAQKNLNWLVGGPSETDVAEADANLDAANAALQEAQWYLSELKGETIPADATGARLNQLQQARDNLKVAQDKLANSRLQAPFNGVIVDVFLQDYEAISPNQPVLLLADLSKLVILTTDMSEVDAARVRIGDSAKVVFDALPGVTAKGKVTRIALRPEQGAGVYYTVKIELDEIPADLRWGMSAFVEIKVSK